MTELLDGYIIYLTKMLEQHIQHKEAITVLLTKVVYET